MLEHNNCKSTEYLNRYIYDRVSEQHWNHQTKCPEVTAYSKFRSSCANTDSTVTWLVIYRKAATFARCYQMYKIINGFATSYLSTRLRKRQEVHRYNTRHKDHLDAPTCRTATAQRSFFYRRVTIWNLLSSKTLRTK